MLAVKGHQFPPPFTLSNALGALYPQASLYITDSFARDGKRRIMAA